MMIRYSLIIALFTTNLFGNSIILRAETDSLITNPKDLQKNFSLYIGGNYGSNYLHYGRTFSDNKPYYSADLTLMHKSGFWTSGSLFHLINETPFINFYDISVGWQENFNSWLDGGITFSRFVFPGANTDNSAAGFSFWTFQAGFDWNFLYTSLYGSFLTGDQIDFYLIIKNSRYFQSKKFNKGRMYASFDPGFTFVAGSRDYYKITQIRRRIGRWPGIILVEQERSFQMLDVEFSFPLALNWNNLSFEPSVTYYYPINLSYNDFSKEGFYLYFSFYLSI
jgi:hypothetical protein